MLSEALHSDMDQLRVVRRESDGAPAVKCPRCEDVIQPMKSMFAGYDCESCGGFIEGATLRSYLKALRRWDDSRPEEME